MWPFDNPLTQKKKKDEGTSSANVPMPVTKKPIYDSKKGNLLGYEYSDGTIDLGKGMISNRPPKVNQAAEIQAEIERANLKKQMEAQLTPPNVAPEQLATLTNLTPEQQALANSPVQLNNNPNLKTVAAIAGERASIAAAGGALTGAGIGSVAGGVGAIPGAIIGGAGAGIVGTISGAWSAFKEVNSDNIAGIDENVNNAEYVINNLDTLARQGGSYEDVKMKLGDSLAQLDLAERQYKEASKNVFEGATHTRKKMEDLEKYKRDILPWKIMLIESALQRPNPVGVQDVYSNYGVQQ